VTNEGNKMSTDALTCVYDKPSTNLYHMVWWRTKKCEPSVNEGHTY